MSVYLCDDFFMHSIHMYSVTAAAATFDSRCSMVFGIQNVFRWCFITIATCIAAAVFSLIFIVYSHHSLSVSLCLSHWQRVCVCTLRSWCSVFLFLLLLFHYTTLILRIICCKLIPFANVSVQTFVRFFLNAISIFHSVIFSILLLYRSFVYIVWMRLYSRSKCLFYALRL